MSSLMPASETQLISIASGNYSQGGMGTIRMYVPHIAQGNGPLHNFFNTPKAAAQKASAHGWVSRSGVSQQYVSLTDRAYAVGNWNDVAISWESEGYANDPLTDAQIEVHARNLVALRAMGHPIELRVNSNDPNGSGVTPHCILGGGHTCPNPDGNRPGPIEAQYPLIVARAAALEGNPNTGEDEEVPTQKEWDDLVKRVSEVQETQQRMLDLSYPNKLSTQLNEMYLNAQKCVYGLISLGANTAPPPKK